jgi:PAS domain-containing protein
MRHLVRDRDDTPAPTESLFHDLFRAIDAGFCIIEVEFKGPRAVDYRFIDVNAAFESMTGLVDAPGRTMRDLAPGHEPFWFDVYGRVAATGENAHFENEAVALGRWFDVHAYRVGDPDAHRVAILFTDISERKRGEMALRDSEERLQQALSAGRGIGTWMWDVKADRVRSDARFAALYGVDPAKAIAGAPIAEFFGGIHPGDLPRVQVAIEAAMRTGVSFSEEYRLLQGDGTSVWVAAQGRCKLAADGTPISFPGVSFDISDRKRVEFVQAVLIEISDRLRAISDPADLTYAACEILGRRLEVSRVGYGIVDKVSETFTVERDWNADGVESLAGVLHFRDYGSYIENLKRGECVVIADAATDERTTSDADALEAISARAFVNMPLVEDGRFVALLYANHAGPRVWLDEDLSLLRDTAERVRAATERLRADIARRQSEEQFRVFAQAAYFTRWWARISEDRGQ